MADIKKARIFLRRGTDTSRLSTELCEGELGYSTDGIRVFVGDGGTLGGNSLGTKTFFLTAGSDVTTLTAVTADGRAEPGDLAFVSTSAYYLSSFNSYVTTSTTSTPNTAVGAVYALSARDGASGDLTWVNVNSGIPISFIDIPDDSIPADKIHGGTISGNVTLVGTIETQDTVTLQGVATNAQKTITGSKYFPLSINSSGTVQALSSVAQLGDNTTTALFLSAGKTGGTALYGDSAGNSTNATAGVSASLTTTGGYTGDSSTFTLSANYYPYTISITDLRAATGDNNLTWDEIEEFHFQFYSVNGENKAGFFGYYNENRNGNVILEYTLNATSGATLVDRVTHGHHIIPNAYVTTESLVLHIGQTAAGGSGQAHLVGIVRRN